MKQRAKAISLLLAVSMLLGMLPSAAVAADTPSVRSEPARSLAAVSGGDDDPSRKVDIVIEKQDTGKVYTVDGKNLGSWLGKWSAANGNSTLQGLSGLGYCLDHTKDARVGHSMPATIQSELRHENQTFIMGCFAAGYPTKDATYARSTMWSYANAQQKRLGIADPITFTQADMATTDAEMRKATQLALWHAHYDIFIEGAYGGNWSGNQDFVSYAAQKGNESAQRIVRTAQAITYTASNWRERTEMPDYGVGAYLGPEANDDFESGWLAGTSDEKNSINFEGALTNEDGEPVGNPKDAIENKDYTPSINGSNPKNNTVYKQRASINGAEENYVIIYFNYYSESDLKNEPLTLEIIGIPTQVKLSNGQYGGAGILTAIVDPNSQEFRDRRPPDGVQDIDSKFVQYGDGTLTAPVELLYRDNSKGVLIGKPKNKVNEEPYRYWGLAKLMIPEWVLTHPNPDNDKDQKEVPEADITIKVTTDNASQYGLYIAQPADNSLQPFMLADADNLTLNAIMDIHWAPDSKNPPPDEAEPGKVFLMKKDALTNLPLQGAEFTLTLDDENCPNEENPNNAKIITDAKGYGETTIRTDVWWEYPEGDGDGPPPPPIRHEEACTHRWKITESKAPTGYLANDSFRTFFAPGEGTYDLGLYLNSKPENTRGYLLKVDAVTGVPLANAIMEFTNIDSGRTWRKTTNSGGLINFQSDNEAETSTYLPAGSYTVREVQAPQGYELSNEVQTFKIGVRDGARVQLTFQNSPKRTLIITKQDAETGERLPGVSFKVSKDGKVIGTYGPTNAMGQLYIYDLADGLYEVEEVSPPDGYMIGAGQGKQSIKVDSSGSQMIFRLLFENTVKRSIVITKDDADTGWKLGGAQFEVKGVDVPFQATVTTAYDGTARLDKLEKGTYTITEKRAPAGYELSGQTKTVVLSEDTAKVVTVDFSNKPKSGLLIRKIDSVTKQPIAEVGFRVEFLGDGGATVLGEYITDQNGLIILEDLEAGWYRVTEMTTADGYVLNSEPYLIQVTDQHASITKTIENNQKNMLNVLKLDAQTGEPLPGAIFNVSTAGGNHIATITTGPNGYATLPNLAPGSYVVQEVEAPDGHIIDPTKQTFEVEETASGRTYTLIFKNDNETNLYIKKVDKATNIGLEGAVFQVKKSNGQVVVERVETGKDGLALVTGLSAGTYIVTETKAPDGYMLNSEAQVVAVEAGQTITIEYSNSKPGSLTIHKVDGGTDIGLAGAVFQLFTIDDKLVGTYTSDKDGYVRIEGLEPGFYIIHEYTAPDGYVASADIKVEIKPFDVTSVTVKNVQKSSLTIQKLDKETKLGVNGATYEVRSMDGTLIGTVTTSVNGTATLNNIKSGFYTVQETVAPENYILNTEKHIVEVKNGEPATVVVENQAFKNIIIHKIDAETGLPLHGAVFELRTVGGSLIAEYTTDNSGTITTKAMAPGFYKVVETKAPNGYVKNDEEYTVELVAGEAATLTVKNAQSTSIQIVKTDSVTGSPLSGAQFEVARADGTIVGYYDTDVTGTVFTERLTPGAYVVKEVKAPVGYQLDKTPQTVVVKTDTPAVLRFENVPETSLLITKLDSQTNQPLNGATFKVVRDADGVTIGTYTTGENGTVATIPLKVGKYTVTETKAPSGYAMDKTAHSVTIEAGKANGLVVKNDPLASLIILKMDSRTNAPVAGAVFKVETADGDFIGQYTTDKSGEALITGLTAGHYIVTEMQAPEGYIVSETPKTITVKYGVVNRVEFIDAERGGLIIKLEDSKDGKQLENGFFVVTDSDGKIVAEGPTDVTGSILVGNLVPGKYTITQTYAPDGYTIGDKEKIEEVIAGTTVTVYFKDSISGLVIEKVDSQTGKTLAGARFKLTRNTDNIVIGEYVTDEDGLALVNGLTPGMYTVEEIVAPTGYAIDNGPQLVHVKESTTAHVTFKDTKLVGIVIHSVDEQTKEPLAGTVFEVYIQNGALVGTYTTDNTGTVQTDALDAGFYVIKQIKAENGYTPKTAEQTVEVTNGQPEVVTFESVAKGTIHVYSYDQNKKGIEGMQIVVTTVDGTLVGEYTTDKSGMAIVTGLEPGHYVVKETEAPEGYVAQIEEKTVKVESNKPTKVYFYHDEVFGLQIQTNIAQTGSALAGVEYTVEKINGERVGKYASNKAGLIFVSLKPGHYVVKMVSVPDGYVLDTESRNVTVVENKPTIETFTIKQLSGIRVRFVDGASGAGIYGMRVLLKDSKGVIVDEYFSDNAGYISLPKDLLNGRYTLEQITVPDGYAVDHIPKTIEVLNAETTEITWVCHKDVGQIQVILTSSEVNEIRGLPAGTLLQDAEFEVLNPITYAVVATMKTDATGVAASNGLPIGRYIVRQKTAAPYYSPSTKETEVYLKIRNDVVRVAYENPSLRLGAVNTIKGNTTVTAGSNMRYDITAVNNNSNAPFDNFFWSIKIPTDSARIGTLYTGSWNDATWYSISYKTNMNDYRVLSEKLLATSKYQFDLSTTALNLQMGEYVTDVRFEFGTVPVGFKLTQNPAIYMYVLPSVYSGYKQILRSECGGKYLEKWITNSALWTTVVNNKNTPSTLPKTGY